MPPAGARVGGDNGVYLVSKLIFELVFELIFKLIFELM